MAEQNMSNFGSVLTILGFEDKFLSSEKFSGLPPLEKICLVTNIINEELKLGRWEKVVQTMYGDPSNISELYDGDKDKLEEEIVKSSRHRSTYMKTEAVNTLKKAGKDGLLFKLAFNIPDLHYEEFMQIAQSADSNFFADAQEGEQRKQRLNQTAADLAMKEEKYRNAFYHFKSIDNTKKINNIFEIVLEKKVGYDDERLLQEIALSNKTQKESRLRKIILKSASGEFNSLTAFALYQKHDIQLLSDEKQNLQKEVVKSSRRHDITNTFSKHPEIQLLWAKQNAEDEPKTAYNIFKEQEYSGEEVTRAVQAGLNLDAFNNKEKVMDTSEINEQHLKEAYSSAPFDVKVKITHNLLAGAAATKLNLAQDYLKELKKLSKQAHKEDKLRLAYNLWIEGGGKLDGKHINQTRTALIKDHIENHFGIMGFLDPSDRRGKVEAYEALIKAKEKIDYLKKAYEIALELGGKRVEKVYEEMVSINPRWATDVFMGKKDEKGLDYVVKYVSSKCGANKNKLRNLVNQYKTD